MQDSVPLEQEIEHYNDPQNYIQILNRMNGYDDITALHYQLADLQTQMKVDLFDPFLFLAIYSQLTGYLWNGNPDSNMPMLTFGTVSYLPLLRTSLTPFGLAFHLDNYFQIDNRLLQVDLSLGDDAFYTRWGGIGIEVEQLVSLDSFDLDLRLAGWKQPRLDLSGESIEVGEFGGAISLRGNYRQQWERLPLFLVIEAGLKSRGFLEGYTLERSPNFMFGIAAEI